MEKDNRQNESLYQKLRINKLFLTVPSEHLQTVISLFTGTVYTRGDYIYREGDIDKTLCLISHGKVAITKSTKSRGDFELYVLEENDFFGELEVLDGLPRTTNARSLMETEILKLDYDSFQTLLEEHHIVALNILRQLSTRLRTTNDMIVDLVNRLMKQDAKEFKQKR